MTSGGGAVGIAITDEPRFPLMERSHGVVEETALYLSLKLESFMRQSEVCVPKGKPKNKELVFGKFDCTELNRANSSATL